jgi:hypothetical protein
MADRLKLLRQDNPKVNMLCLVYNWLLSEANGQWLIILNNVNNKSVIFRENNTIKGVLSHD